MENIKTSSGYMYRDCNIFLDTLVSIVPVMKQVLIPCTLGFIIFIVRSVLTGYLTLHQFSYCVFLYCITILLILSLFWSLAILYLILPNKSVFISLSVMRNLQFYRVTGKVCVPDLDNPSLYFFYLNFSSSELSFLHDIADTDDILLQHKILTLLEIHEDLFGKHPSKYLDIILIKCAQFKYLYDDIQASIV